jgi:hypothetical protein
VQTQKVWQKFTKGITPQKFAAPVSNNNTGALFLVTGIGDQECTK